MNQKQAKRLRRMQTEIGMAHAIARDATRRIIAIEKRLSTRKPTLWQRVCRRLRGPKG